MIEQAIEAIKALADDARRTQFVRRPGDPPDVVWEIGPHGAAERQVIDHPVNVKLDTPFELKAYVEARCGDGAECFVDGQQAFAWTDKERRNRAWCPLPPTPAWAFLTAPPRRLKHFELVRILRITFRGCLDPDSSFLDQVRLVRFDAQGMVRSERQNAKESVERSALAEVNRDVKLPEEFMVGTSLFDNFPCAIRFPVAFEVFPTDQEFQITPYPLELKRALEETLTRLRESLPEPNYLGMPAFPKWPAA